MNSPTQIRKTFSRHSPKFLVALMLALACETVLAGTVAQTPLFLGQGGAPLVLLTMSRDHKLYAPAYNDASDINGDGTLDIHYNPNLPDPSNSGSVMDYYGYFDSHTCYTYANGLFSPSGATGTSKTCSGKWSGDFLNYITTSRMDALRKVLYGGYRSTDTAASTILQRVYIPQDAHTWGHQYTSTAVDGYDISHYAPLSQPATGTYHLFANTTLLCPNGAGGTTDGSSSDPGCIAANLGLPLMRVITNSSYRIWEWVSIERPNGGVLCATGNNVRSACASGGGHYDSYPSNASDFDTLVSQFADSTHLEGSGSLSSINTTSTNGNNPYGSNQYYLNIISGTLNVKTAGDYQFAVDGDDAVDVSIDGVVVAGWYGGHGLCSCSSHASSTITLSAGHHTVLFRHQQRTGDDNYYLWLQRSSPSTLSWEKIPVASDDTHRGFRGLTQSIYNVNTVVSAMTDYIVRNQVCVAGSLENNCKGYPASGTATSYKPIGVLQDKGDTDLMKFGLLTGSYHNNISGGVLRKNVSTFTDEVDPNTGVFTSVNGIISTISKLKTIGYGGNYSYVDNCAVPEVGSPLSQGVCDMWGNPIAEMMYEGLRYFSGKSGPTTDYSTGVNGATTHDTQLQLPLATWTNPYGSSGFPSCSAPIQLVISDIYPADDTDLIPRGYAFDSSSGSFTGDITGLNVVTQANTIWAGEQEGSNIFIGQSGSTYDGAPTPKTVNSFGNIRGLAPEEPTRQGGYYAAAIASYGKTNDLNIAAGNQMVDQFSVVLSSPHPQIKIPVAGKTITLVPFAKSAGGCGVTSTSGHYQPTDQLVNFYVQTLKNTDATNQDASVNGGLAYGQFLINFEDSEYGSDYDMDAIPQYTFAAKSDGSVDITLNSVYAAGCVIQHMGYVISGTTTDGVYLEVRDSDTASGSDVNYFLDTPQHAGSDLPLSHTRNFKPGTTSAAFIKHDPLWYAAKWGGFSDANNNHKLDQGATPNSGGEWDTNNDGTPDSYFLVTNASNLKKQLDAAFTEITKRTSSASAIATNTTRTSSNALIFQAKFNSGDWSGEVVAYQLSASGGIGNVVWDTTSSGKIPSSANRKIYSFNPLASAGSQGIEFKWASLNSTQKRSLDNVTSATASSSPVVDYLRGDQSKETHNGCSGCTYRDRSVLLGDIANSDPIYVGTENFGYDVLPGTEGSSYLTFRSSSAYRARRAMLYVGSNDGMLHAFDANTGVEQFAYLPNVVISPELALLTSQGYGGGNHKYYVDGSPQVGDVYLNDNSWHTVVLGTMGAGNTTICYTDALGTYACPSSPPTAPALPAINYYPLGAGGRGIFAMDVTYPDSFGTANVLWEFTNRNQADLGYTIPQPSITRTNSASNPWAAIVANGYQSPAGHAVLFIRKLQDGTKLATIDTCPNPIPTPTPAHCTNNGLSSPVIVDSNGDKIAEYVYAGDLQGNLWKFDLTSTDPSAWTVSYSGTPLFVAKDRDGNRQPITAKPLVGPANAQGQSNGTMIYFGTGQYFAQNDNTIPNPRAIQTFYGIWDQCDTTNSFSCTGVVAGRGNLQEQAILDESSSTLTLGSGGASLATTLSSGATTATDVRVTSTCAVTYGSVVPTSTPSTPCTNNTSRKGWFMDLLSALPSNALPAPGQWQSDLSRWFQGERVVSSALLMTNASGSTESLIFSGSSGQVGNVITSGSSQNRVLFPTLIPSTDPCTYGGTSWLMELDARSGAALPQSAFGVAGNSNITDADKVLFYAVSGNNPVSGSGGGGGGASSVSMAISGVKSGVGIIPKPPATMCMTGCGGGKRLSWRQLR